MSSGTDARVVDHVTGHWEHAGLLALALGGTGVLLGSAGLVLSAIVCVTFVGYAATVGAPRVHDPERGEAVLSIRRRLDDATPAPDDEVTVTVEVHNRSGGPLTDVRIVDGVPAALDVTDGSPRHGATLRPDGSTAFSYSVRATRGEYDWRPAQVTVADPSGAFERETTIDAATTLRCSLPALGSEALPLRGLTTSYTGLVETDSGGSGLEFFSTREYRASDPISRIDWRRLAKTGELGTHEYREERAASVMLVLDTRRAAYLAPKPGTAHAVERSIDAANRVFSALLDAGDRVGITAFGSSDECWLAPGMGNDHRAHGRELLSTHPALSPIPPEMGLHDRFRPDRREELKARRIRRLHRRLSPETQVFLFSPCCDGYVPEVARQLDAHGHLVTVLSPDPTTDDTGFDDLAAMERADRLAALRREGLRVADWKRDEHFAAPLARLEARWSA